jgi:EAL domain-containing protein (putative c-di-GMP-specific phosphodiesterase class I)
VENPQDEAIVRAIVQMAHSLNLTVLAEGIENRQTLERLVALGCDLGQGFLWAPGMPVKDFEKLLGEQASPV